MSHAWKLLPLWASLAVLGALLLVPGGVAKPSTVHALPCGDAAELGTGTLIVRVVDVATNDLVSVPSSVIQITPNPDGSEETLTVVDNAGLDSDLSTGVIRLEGACAGETYSASFAGSQHPLLDGCAVPPPPASQTLPLGSIRTFVVQVDCTHATAGVPATLHIDLSPDSFPCDGAAIVTVQVRDASGIPVGLAPVRMQATRGAFNPDTKETALHGSTFFIYSAPSSQPGPVIFTATSGDASQTVTATLRNEDCGAVAGPPATSVPSSPGQSSAAGTGTGAITITPPNTGSAGLAGPAAGAGGLLPAAVLGAGLVLAGACFALGRRRDLNTTS